MGTNGLIKILALHGVKNQITDGKLYAWEEATTRINGEVIDISGWVLASAWTKKDLLDWLGY